MVHQREHPDYLLKLYLHFHLPGGLWEKQFLIIAAKPRSVCERRRMTARFSKNRSMPPKSRHVRNRHRFVDPIFEV